MWTATFLTFLKPSTLRGSLRGKRRSFAVCAARKQLGLYHWGLCPAHQSFLLHEIRHLYLWFDLTFCICFGRRSINGKKTRGESSFQRNLRTSAALEPSVYFTFFTPWMGNRGYIVKFIRMCTLYLTLIPFHHVCINKGFTVCKKH